MVLLASCLAPPSAAQSTGGETLQEALETADQLREQRNFRESLNHLSSLREEHPETVGVLWRLAFTWADLGKATERQRQRSNYYERAIDVANEAVAADSTSAWAHLTVAIAEGRVALSAGTRERIQRSRAVKRHADRAIELDSTLATAYHVRGQWHREVASLGFVQRTIVRTVYGGLPDASYEQAVRDFKRAIELDTKVYHHLELGKTYIAMGQTEAARQELQSALDLPRTDPFDPEYKQEAREKLEELS